MAEPDVAKGKPKATKSKSNSKSASVKPRKSKGKKLAKAKGKDKGAKAPVELTQKNLDPAHVAADLLQDAGQKSPLELLGSYKQTVEQGDLETAAVLLRVAADAEISHPLIVQANDLLGVALDTQDTEVLVEIGRTPRAAAVTRAVAPKPAAPAATPNNARIEAAHALVAAAPRTSTIDYLGAYKFAVLAGNSEAAAVALAGALRKPIDEGSVIQANALLGLAGNVTANAVGAETGRSSTIGAAQQIPVVEPTTEPALHY